MIRSLLPCVQQSDLVRGARLYVFAQLLSLVVCPVVLGVGISSDFTSFTTQQTLEIPPGPPGDPRAVSCRLWSASWIDSACGTAYLDPLRRLNPREEKSESHVCSKAKTKQVSSVRKSNVARFSLLWLLSLPFILYVHVCTHLCLDISGSSV